MTGIIAKRSVLQQFIVASRRTKAFHLSSSHHPVAFKVHISLLVLGPRLAVDFGENRSVDADVDVRPEIKEFLVTVP